MDASSVTCWRTKNDFLHVLDTNRKKIDKKCMTVEIQFSTVYFHLAAKVSNNHLVYEMLRESTGYLEEKKQDTPEDIVEKLKKPAKTIDLN